MKDVGQPEGTMNIIKRMLKEELQNSIKIKQRYVSALGKIPKGSLREKKVKGRAYYYLNIREGSKVKSPYLGKLSREEIKKYEEDRKKKEQYRQAIKELSGQIKYLKRIINVKSE